MVRSPHINMQQFKDFVGFGCALWKGHSGLSRHGAYGTSKELSGGEFYKYS